MMSLHAKLALKFRMLGSDGMLTLLLSNLVICLSLGLTLIPMVRKVYLIAKFAPCGTEPGHRLLVLGVCLRHDQITARFKQRLDRALTLYQGEHTGGILILGGITGGNTLSEASKGKQYLLGKGVKAVNLATEDQSRNTLENLKHALPLLASQAKPPTLISNRFHLARCATLAEGVGLAHRLCAAEDSFRLSLISALQIFFEGYYLHWYATGKRWSRWTGNKKSLERIS